MNEAAVHTARNGQYRTENHAIIENTDTVEMSLNSRLISSICVHRRFWSVFLIFKTVWPLKSLERNNSRTWKGRGLFSPVLMQFAWLPSTLDPLLTQNTKKAGRAGRKQWKIRRANGGKKHKSEPKQLRFARETTYGPEGRGFESLTAYQKSSKSSDFEDFCFL